MSVATEFVVSDQLSSSILSWNGLIVFLIESLKVELERQDFLISSQHGPEEAEEKNDDCQCQSKNTVDEIIGRYLILARDRSQEVLVPDSLQLSWTREHVGHLFRLRTLKEKSEKERKIRSRG